jgi:hypothetical protein
MPALAQELRVHRAGRTRGYFILDRKSLEDLLERVTAGEEALEIERFLEGLLLIDRG